VILAVDDDRDVLRAIERDLRSRFASKYRIVTASSGTEALTVLKRLKQRNDPVALLVVDQRMPHMTGVQLLEQSAALFPEARRVLLTAYADTDAAIRAINSARVHHYLVKPWDPPERELYPVLDGLLSDWMATYRAPFSGIRVVGTRWDPRAFELKDFLTRNHVPYQWLDVERAPQDANVQQVVSTFEEKARYPVVLFQDGSRLDAPEMNELADKVGLQRHAESKFYDVVIVGGGPAGLAAAVYGASEGLRTVMIEREAPGGQAGLSSKIENYLGFPAGLSGSELAHRAVTQARRFGVEILAPQEACGLVVDGPYRSIVTSDGSDISCHALLLATGVQWRKLDVPDIDRFHGAGVYYGGALQEAMSCRDEVVFIIGGANSAGQAAMYFSRFARRVVMLVRGESLSSTMSQYLVARIEATPNIDVEVKTRVVAVHGETHLEKITVVCGDDDAGETREIEATSIFVFIGAEPKTEWLGEYVERDERGFVLTGPELMRNGKRPPGWPLDRDPMLLETSVPGIFALGDVRRGSVKRVASSVGEGAVAIQFVHQYLASV
jgi:thioredoxin reductase (NADPH)